MKRKVEQIKIRINRWVRRRTAWRAWRLDGGSLTDTLTGRVEEFGALLATLLGEGPGGPLPMEEG